MSKVKIRTRLKESDDTQSSSSASKFKVILIQEGLGNLGDCFYYSKECLQSSYSIFEGKKCYADHPSSFEEQTLPERSTRDIIGYFSNVQFEEVAARGAITATLCLVNDASVDWARALLTNCIEYAKQYQDSDFVGLSINANGQADSIAIDDFIKSNQVPSSVMTKLDLAKSEGISDIRVVSQLTESISCDMVTEAGAGGKILQMIEGDKKAMKLKNKVREDGAPKKAPMPAAAPGGSGQDDGHDDQAQDKALFAKMIKQYLGDGAGGADEEEAMQMAKHVYEAYQADGMESKEAYEAAGQHLKMALNVSKKMQQAKKEADGMEAEPTAEASDDAPPKSAQPAPDKASAGSASKEAAHVVELAGEVAKLRESVKKYELRDYLDQKLAKSKKSNSITKAFREALGVPKSKAHIDETFNLFMKAVECRTEEVSDDASVFFTEKQSFRESSDGDKTGSFADCLK